MKSEKEALRQKYIDGLIQKYPEFKFTQTAGGVCVLIARDWEHFFGYDDTIEASLIFARSSLKLQNRP